MTFTIPTVAWVLPLVLILIALYLWAAHRYFMPWWMEKWEHRYERGLVKRGFSREDIEFIMDRGAG